MRVKLKDDLLEIDRGNKKLRRVLRISKSKSGFLYSRRVQALVTEVVVEIFFRRISLRIYKNNFLFHLNIVNSST